MMDEDSILFQAMKSEMNPEVMQASMRMTDPNNPYPIGAEMRMKSPGGPLSNPLRMQRPPTDFAGRPSGANENMRGPVVDRTQQFQRQQQENMRNQIMNEVAQEAQTANPANKGMMQRILDFYRGID
jgi:hypothetical protein